MSSPAWRRWRAYYYPNVHWDPMAEFTAAALTGVADEYLADWLYFGAPTSFVLANAEVIRKLLRLWEQPTPSKGRSRRRAAMGLVADALTLALDVPAATTASRRADRLRLRVRQPHSERDTHG